MVKHVLIWKLKPELLGEKRAEATARAKRELEALVGKIDGLISLKVITEPYESSTGDMLLYSEFESKEALAAYQTDPLHVAAATYVRSIVCDRACADFEI